ncbi:MAG: acyl-CoA dehydrogenase [Gemmatimonadota bacterium]|nr:acyl-CoA dehydrogenase [Gemmatimonadota bacterium]
MDVLTSSFGALSFSYVETAGIAVLVCVLGFTGAPLWLWTVFSAAGLWAFGAPNGLWWVFGVLAPILNLRPLRRILISFWILRILRALKRLPTVSPTEQAAIEAGSVWIDADLFSGKPDFRRLNGEPYPELNERERAFLNGPVEAACRMADDWQIHRDRDLPRELWDYLNAKRFYGIIIPEEFGGLGFSASAHSAIVGKLASRSMPLAVTVMVPNSLGPAELLIHYGTRDQKDRFLPRLARGEEIPCFALTEPNAGSDAGSIRSSGVVFMGEDGRPYLRLNWNKRYITLASVSTLIGLAFKLRDPDNLLGRGNNPGITCALVPRDTPGVVVDRRHDPMGVPFHNAPTEGRDVVVPADAIIGGPQGAGQGWRMLMESLAAGRGISLPATAAFGAKLTARVAGAHATVRKQFGLSIGQFQGVEEPLARIGAFTYLMEAARRFTCGGLDGGAKSAVVSAIVKFNLTELHRRVILDGMDVLAGNAIAQGPRNLLARSYLWAPIAITVEGANILTRTFITFGQGAIRCHPYIYEEIQALGTGNLRAFDRAFWGHAGHFLRNAFRAALLSLSRGYLAASPVRGPASRYYRKLAWTSASFAFLADVALITIGGALKKEEKLAGRFADVLSWMYLGTAVLRRFEAEGRRPGHLPYLHWAMQYALAQIQLGFSGLFRNLRAPAGLGLLFRYPVALWSRLNPIGRMPSDVLGGDVARAIRTPGPDRDALTPDIYLPDSADEPLGRLEAALLLSRRAEPVSRMINEAARAGLLSGRDPQRLVEQAIEKELITREDAALYRRAETARDEAVRVDAFTPEEYLPLPDRG